MLLSSLHVGSAQSYDDLLLLNDVEVCRNSI